MRAFIQLPVLRDRSPWYHTYVDLSRACQLKRLYQLFGYDPVTWEEAVKAVDVDKEVYVSSGRSVMHAPSVDWACDYP